MQLLQPQPELQPLHPLQALQPQPEQQPHPQQQRLQAQQSQQLTFCATTGSPQPQFVIRSDTQLLHPKVLIPPNTHAIENPSHKMSRGIAPTGPSYVEARHLVRSAGSGDGITYSV